MSDTPEKANKKPLVISSIITLVGCLILDLTSGMTVTGVIALGVGIIGMIIGIHIALKIKFDDEVAPPDIGD